MKVYIYNVLSKCLQIAKQKLYKQFGYLTGRLALLASLTIQSYLIIAIKVYSYNILSECLQITKQNKKYYTHNSVT